MWNWLFWLGRVIRVVPAKKIEVRVMEEPKPTEQPDQLACLVSHNPLQTTFMEAFRETHRLMHEKELELLNDEKLRSYLKKSFSYLATQLLTVGSGSSILFSADHIGMPPTLFHPTFFHIFQGVCKELEIEAKFPNDTYIFVNVRSLRKAVEKLSLPEVDVEERIRAMCFKNGPYR